ncbi:choice-of-anchor P family protein [Iamia sp.]|uniref:choice-of-anchor P family protein n=1 Tax=Iamia sp. TaxID=2722710 RepID=UPI002C5343D0|nr:choice-of-anchor P family protein [Iamia sp.]HXH58643.1 choice-of-anchor P family protein [Iamia sp.]
MALVATAAIGLLLAMGAAPASAAPLDASAFGLSASVSVAGAAAVDVPPTPAVDCPPDMSEEVVDLSVPGVATADAVTAECSTTDGVVSAMATIANANIADLVTAEVVSAQCTANGEPEGSSVITNLVVNGEPITVAADPNTVVEIPGVGTVTLNRQTFVENADGTTTITVDAVVVDLDVPSELPLPGLPPLPPTTVDAVLASVSCTSSAAVMEPPVTEPPVTEPPTTEPPTTEAPPTTDPGDPGDTGTTAPPPPAGELPRTGSTSTGTMVGLGVALLAAGALSLAASRRRGAHTA